MSKFSQYQTFITVVNEGSLSAAARALNITPSAVSKQLGVLETTVKVQLLERSNRSVMPTLAGKRFYQQCRDILSSVKQAEESLLMSDQSLSGRLSITLSKSLARSDVIDSVFQFSQLHPQIVFNLQMSDQIADLHNEDIDFAFRLGRLPDNSRLYAQPLTTVTLVCCATPAYIVNAGCPKKLHDLKHHKLILPMPENLSEQLWTFFKKEKFTVLWNNCHNTDDIESVYQAVDSNRCVGFMLDMSIHKELASGQFINLLSETKLPTKTLYLISKKQSLHTRKHKEFKAFIKSQFSTTP